MKNPLAHKTRLAISDDWLAALRHKRSDLFAHTQTYAVECVIAEACGLPHPRTPDERVKAGAQMRGQQIKKAAKLARKNKD